MTKYIRLTFGLFLILLASLSLIFQPASAQSDDSLALVMTADGPIMPPMLDYIRRGVETADRRNAEVLIIQLNTPGGSVLTTFEIIHEIRSSDVPVVVFVSPKNAIAGSAGAIITMVGHASAMAPETTIGASTPINSSGENLTSDARAKEVNAIQAAFRPYVEPRGEEALALANAMIEEAKAVTATEALEVNLVDAIVDNVDDLLEALDGMTVEMEEGTHTFHTASADIEPLEMTLIEQLLLFLTNPNIVFSLLSVGMIFILIEISSPGGWFAGFLGVSCLLVALYGIGLLSVNWFGLLFLVVAFALFIMEIHAPTQGALTIAGVISFIIGALVLFNSAGTPEFQRVSVPLVIATGVTIGLMFFAILMYALRALRAPISSGVNLFVGKTGTAKTSVNGSGGQVQLGSELWTAEAVETSDKIRKGDAVEVVEVKGLRLKVKKK